MGLNGSNVDEDDTFRSTANMSLILNTLKNFKSPSLTWQDLLQPWKSKQIEEILSFIVVISLQISAPGIKCTWILKWKCMTMHIASHSVSHCLSLRSRISKDRASLLAVCPSLKEIPRLTRELPWKVLIIKILKQIPPKISGMRSSECKREFKKFAPIHL